MAAGVRGAATIGGGTTGGAPKRRLTQISNNRIVDRKRMYTTVPKEDCMRAIGIVDGLKK
jgi:hypothetical protein